MSMGGGSGGSGNQTSTFSPPLWTLNQWPDFTQAAEVLTTQPYQQYPGQKIAPINTTQAQAMQYASNLAGNLSPDMYAMRQMLQTTAAGGFENPYASVQTVVPGNPYVGQTADVGWNPYLDKTTNVTSNRYSGFSPEYQNFKQSSLNDTVEAYKRGTAAQTDSAFNRVGAFHGGGHDAQISANENNLARNLGRQGSEMDFGQWDRTGGLEQQRINLQTQAQQADLARQTAGSQAWLSMLNQSAQNDLMRNAQLYQQGIGMGVDAQQQDLNRASQGWNQERDRQMGAFNPILQANQFDQQNAQRLLGIGDIQRGYSQDLLNSQYQDWQQQQNYPMSMLDTYANALARASGNYGSNSQMYQQPGYQANPFASALGAGLVGAGLYNGWNQ